MLTELVVEGLGVIDRAELDLTSGSSALTGETGAGKTLLVVALSLLLGARADKTLVRRGADRARVDARFDPAQSHPSWRLLQEHGVLEELGTEVVLTRTVTSDGRSRARINGRPVTLSQLQEVGRSLVEIAGQNEHHHLASTSAQRELLDSFAGEETVDLAAKVAEGVRELTRLRGELEELDTSARDRARELDILRTEIAEIEAVDPKPEETAELIAVAARLEHADAIASALGSAVHKLKGEGGAGESLSDASKEVGSIMELDPTIGPIEARLTGVAVEVADIAEDLSRSNIHADPEELAATRDRLAAVTRLLKKFGATEADVLVYLEQAKKRADVLESSGIDRERLTADIAGRARDTSLLAEGLTARRMRAARLLEERVGSKLAELALGDARFEIEFSPRDLYVGGSESIQFLISANPGETAKPLNKVASGGELSRIALALRLLTSTGDAPTLVFDEVDAGVGGEAARAVGDCLARLGKLEGTQVLVVTHLPQVAAFADHQYRVSKVVADDRSSSMVEHVEGDDRIEELSRMLAGLPESERAREHAQELLELAGRREPG